MSSSSGLPLVSVIIPTYQCAAYVGQAVESALAQTYLKARFEVVVIDDGSTDGTRQVLEPFGERIVYRYQDNHGLATARNEGIRVARGDLLAFLDADDYWLPHRVAMMVEALGGAENAAVVTDVFIRRGDEVSTVGYYHERDFVGFFQLEAEQQLKKTLEDNFLPYMLMAPRSLVVRVGMYDETLRYGEDWDLWLRLLSAGCAVRFVDQPCAVYRAMRPGALSTHNNAKRADDRLKVLRKYRALVSKRRWNLAKGVADRVAAQDALAAGSYAKAAVRALGLLSNGTYLMWALGKRVRAINGVKSVP